VARAKRTERAEARRRYRAATAPQPIDDAADLDTASTPSAGSTKPRPPGSPTQKAAATGSTARVGFADAFRMSFRPINVRQDVAALPWIATHTHALWIPLAITLASTVFIVASGTTSTISEFMFAYFIQTPAIGSVFIAGFLAPRAAWLLGVVVGFVSAICYSVLVVAFPTSIYVAAPPSADVTRDVVVSALVLSPLIGAFFAAGAAWYRRFLALSSPNRGNKKQSQTAKAKPGDGRTRSAASQKASAKR
jgi:hypothetical protein